jgi:hypothetical protein
VKGQYRKWNIKTAQTNDDFAMMREVFQRRFGARRTKTRTATAALARSGADRRRQGPDERGARYAGGTGDRGRAADRHRQGPAPRARGARGVPFPRWPRKDAAGQRAAAVPPPAPARRGAPLRHRRAPRQAQPGDHRQSRWTKFRASARRASARCCCTSARRAGCERLRWKTCNARRESARRWRNLSTISIIRADEDSPARSSQG